MISGNLKLFHKEYKFLLFSIVILSFVVYKTVIIPSEHGKIKVNIYQNRTAIRNINQKRDIKNRNVYYVNKLNFTKNKHTLTTENGYNLAYRNNFFIDFETDIVVNKDENISFIVYSDDGFILDIDKNNIMQYIGDRPLKKDVKSIYLKKGTHKYRLHYYQGSGFLGVKALYNIDGKTWEIGEDSKYIKFKQ